MASMPDAFGERAASNNQKNGRKKIKFFLERPLLPLISMPAKSGTVTAPIGGTTDLAKSALNVAAPIMTLGQMVAAALSGSNNPLVCHVDVANRKVEVWDAAKANAMSNAIQAGIANAVDALSQDSPGGKTAAWSASKNSALSAPITTAVKPQFSIAALISALESYISSNSGETTKDVYVDQVQGNVYAFPAPVTQPSNTAPDVELDQTVAASTGTIRNAFE